MPKGQNFALLLLLPLRHTLFPPDFSETTADTDITNTSLEPIRPTDVPFGVTKPKQDQGGIFLPQNRFLAVVAPPSE